MTALAAVQSERLDDAVSVPCSCGSGLARPHCCGLDLRAVRIAFPGGADTAQVQAMRDAMRCDDNHSAQALAIAVLTQVQGHKEALHVLFKVLRQGERWDAASVVVDRYARVHQTDPVARMTAAQYLLWRGEVARASFHARVLVQLAPEAVVSHHLMGKVFLAIHNLVAAEHHFRLALDPRICHGPPVNLADIESSLAITLRHQGRFEEARSIFRLLCDERNPSLSTLLAWSELEEAAGDFAQSAALLDRAAALAPGDVHIVVARAKLLRRMNEPEQALHLLQGESGEDSDSDMTRLLQKGQTLDAMGRYDEAFGAFAACKALARTHRGGVYRAEEARALVSGLREFFTVGRDHLFPRARTLIDRPQPIFIVGFPRSGTTLVEQTLSRHANIAGGDELPIIGNLARRMQELLGGTFAYPRALSELWLGDRARHIDVLRDLYLNEAAQLGAVNSEKRWFTDKMPLNETHLGLINLMFPSSPIVHVVRHPLDVVLSVFSNMLTHGFCCANELETAARHYALISDLIEHYRTTLPLRYHAVKYENLVYDQEAEVRRLFDFVDEEFDPNTLDFHKNPRPARTASYAQVNEKLYSRSCYRYRNYRSHLECIIPILQPAIERLGYAVEP
jgi:tetratricopeptide (TPR) repeat protein